ncbi:MAG: hypothetical protein NDJ72_06850 [Elusimicrobia bacterium]|nr:hypothetical protein [Elusimicrobiota bacterium]
MRRLLPLLILPFAILRAQAGTAAAAVKEAPRIIMPGAPFGSNSAPGVILAPTAPSLIVPNSPSLIVPAAPVIQAPAPAIIVAARPMTPEENAPAKMPSQSELKALAESLAPTRGAEGQSGAAQSKALDSAFDGKLAPEAAAWSDLSPSFSAAPTTPGLETVATAGRSLIARLLPSLYRRVPARAAYDRGERPSTGHTWTPERGHLIEINPIRANSDGNVPSAFGGAHEPLIQQKISHLMEYAHEYFHVLFDDATRRKENHPMTSAYSAMTEGFAVTGEQLLGERMLELAPSLGLGPRDVMDLAGILSGRRRWLDVEDNHYSEGALSWRKAFQDGGLEGVASMLASLSARRMIATPRSDPAYQLVLGDPKLLSAYLGRDESSAERRGADAFAKAVRGEKMTEAETREAAAVVERAGPDAWRRLFERTLRSDKRLAAPKEAAAETANWWEKKKAEPMASVEPVFVLARLSPAAGAALSRYLAAAISEPGGAVRLFERSGPNEKLTAIINGAEALPWDEADRKAWNDGLSRWLIGV